MSIAQRWIFLLSKHWEILSTISHICFEEILTPEKVSRNKTRGYQESVIAYLTYIGNVHK